MKWIRSSLAFRVAGALAGGVVLAAAVAAVVTMASMEDTMALSTVEVAAQPSAAEVSPTADLVAIEQGRVYYAQICMSCHGARGDGAGEWAYRVTPRPANLTSARTQRRSDAELFGVISAGRPGTAMIGWEKQLSEAQRWQVVAYVRHLGSGNGQEKAH